MELAKHYNDLVSQFGVAVELDSVDISTTVDAWYDTVPNWTTSTITVLWKSEIRKDAWYLEGLIKEGDAICFVASTQTINIRDRVVKDSVTYEVVSIEPSELQGTKMEIKVALKRFLDS